VDVGLNVERLILFEHSLSSARLLSIGRSEGKEFSNSLKTQPLDWKFVW